jgi:hypothetical protein
MLIYAVMLNKTSDAYLYLMLNRMSGANLYCDT